MAAERCYDMFQPAGGVPVKSWTRGVQFEETARKQLENISRLPFIHGWVAAMPDVHWGIGATVGSVIATHGAIVPAAVGVDIGCGMMAVRTSLGASDLPDSLRALRSEIERAVPHGLSRSRGGRDKGSWGDVPADVDAEWARLAPGFERIVAKHRSLRKSNQRVHLGTLGTGNHFIEICLDEEGRLWVMLHSGSRGVGNKIGRHFIELAKKDMAHQLATLPDANLAYLREGSAHFDDYVDAVSWAQDFALTNRRLMMTHVLEALRRSPGIRPFETTDLAVNCHHNYVARERHLGKDVFVTRKGAVRARLGDLGIIPGSMGARSYIVRGKGNPESFTSCSHGAGRAMSRAEAKRRFSLADHAAATAGVECRKDAEVIDETPGAYKSIDAVMEAQRDLVEIVHELRQVVCVKG
ncbi:MAG TPA: RtcB family protein [Myxococcota bacterium]|nr:RtcB family protein [Myxococcota bacterium]